MWYPVFLTHLVIKKEAWSAWPLLTHPAAWVLAVLGGVALWLVLRSEVRGD